MRKFLPVLLGCGSVMLLSLPLPAKAQEYQGCFMVNSSGRLIELSEICPSPSLATSTQQANQAASSTPDVRVIAYADGFCQAKKDGMTDDAARGRGVSAMFNVSTSPPSNDLLTQAVLTTQKMCPQYFQ